MPDIQELTDDELVDHTNRKVWLSAFAANNQRSKYHAEADACFNEATRRGKPHLYQRGWNMAADSCGMHVTKDERLAAEDPVEADQ
jgi:hypothetical protein